MDWTKLIADLVEVGLTQKEIADQCGVSQPTVSFLARGKTAAPTFDFGTKLQSLHRLRCSAPSSAKAA